MYIYIYLCVCVCIWMYIYIYRHMCVCENVYIYIQAYVCVWKCIYIYMCISPFSRPAEPFRNKVSDLFGHQFWGRWWFRSWDGNQALQQSLTPNQIPISKIASAEHMGLLIYRTGLKIFKVQKKCETNTAPVLGRQIPWFLTMASSLLGTGL